AFSIYARDAGRAARKGVQAIRFGTPLPTTLELRPATTLSGVVRTEEGRPVAGATVRILDDERYAPGPHREVLARSDSQGRWRIEGMLYGRFRLLVQAPWGVATTARVELRDRETAPAVASVVPRQWPVSGVVQDETGTPLAHVRLESGL